MEDIIILIDMMGLIEGFRTRVSRNIFHTKNNLPLYVVPDISSEQTALPASIKERAHTIAENVRKYGKQEFGRMWAQGYAVLPDGRIVFLQQSQGEVQEDKDLEINILDTPNCHNRIHIRYDLKGNEINTFEIRQEDGKPIIAYWIYDRPDYGTRVPANLSLRNIVGLVEDILQSVEIASNKIMWKEPDPSTLLRTDSAQIRF